MGLDNYTRAIYGWKLTGKSARNIFQDLEDVCCDEYNSDTYDLLDGYYVEDSMCGEYYYFGVLLGSMDVYDCERGADNDIIITKDLIEKSKEKWNNFLEKYPKLIEVFDYYKKNQEPKLYIVQNIW